MNQQLKHKALAGAIWMLVQRLGAQVSTLVVFVVLARLLDARDFGLMAMAYVITQFLSMFASQGLTSAIIQRQDLEPTHLDTAFWLNLSLGSIIAILCFASAPGLAQLYGEPEVATLIAVLSINIVLESLTSIQNSILQRRMEFKSIAIRKLVGEVCGGITGISLALMGFGVWSLVIRTIVSMGVQVLLFWLLTAWRPKWRFSLPHMKDIVGYGSKVLGVNVVNFSGQQLDNFLIGLLLGPVILGQYNIAKRLIMISIDLIRGGVGSVAWTLFSRLQDSKDQLQSAMLKINQLVSIITFPLFAALGLFGGQYVPLLFGEKWLVCVPIIQFLSITGLIESTRSSHESLILAVGESGKRLQLAIILASTNLIGFLLIYPQGVVAISTVYAMIALALFPLWIRHTLNLSGLRLKDYLYSYKEALLATLAALAMHGLLHFYAGFFFSSLIGFFVEIVVIGLTYLAAIHLLNRQLIPSLLKKLKR